MFLIIGNGMVGLAIAAGLSRSVPADQIQVIGPADRTNSASMAAAAMLNSFAELEPGALDQPRDRLKFELSQASARLWGNFVEEFDIPAAHYRLGTVLVNNNASNAFEDAAFDAIAGYLDEFAEPFERIEPNMEPAYMPGSSYRSRQALFLPREGVVNPDGVIHALQASLVKRGVRFIDGTVQALDKVGGCTRGVTLADGRVLAGERVVLANGSMATRLWQEQDCIRVINGVGATVVLKNPGIKGRYVLRTPNRGGACGIYHAPYQDDLFVVGATNLVTTVDEQYPRAEAVAALINGAINQVNQMHRASGLVRYNFGYRPVSLDGYPVLGQLNDNTFIATGTRRDGYHFAPWLADNFAALLLDKPITGQARAYFEHARPQRSALLDQPIEACCRKYAAVKCSALSQHGYDAGHTDADQAMEQYYYHRARDFFEMHGLEQAIQVDFLDALIGGYLSLDDFT
ncbi:glycine/D-amino acid oxidase-like deaminating enzyme [Pseudomonas sp. BIGb0278]|jgi:glycine oxidase|uniref:NAD(P)/FAD-dependent oxidoreductase n=1 Tax=Pseudomonas TaxID=286 RepID=UPI0015E2B0EC|nr:MULTISPECIES: FAD-dependent oxidoreductase [Pseudomonas]MBA1322224.1 FAD-binding oxidoreductase [Pseudomonas plecoglossicida]MCS4285711.1 glycine/D-amino acid oxidase-like deaminating enzyme [Pseudomonas sp. BIGb0278]